MCLHACMVVCSYMNVLRHRTFMHYIDNRQELEKYLSELLTMKITPDELIEKANSGS